jgi:Bardet-Biedl syndrome 2 protein
MKRSTNHEALLSCLREVNVAIDLASKLRSGSCRTQLVTAARAAVKANNPAALVNVLSEGTKRQQKLMT